MRKLYILFSLIISVSISAFGGVTKIDNGTRQYMIVTPETPSESPRPLVVFLHELGGNISNYEEIAQQMANATGAVMLLPQALDEQSTTILALNSLLSGLSIPGAPEIPIYSIWNAGVSITLDNDQKMFLLLMSMSYPELAEIAAAGKIVSNANVNDVGFINSIINDTKASHDIDQSRIYMFGISMGGAMTYKYAFSEGAQVSAIAVISGFIGAEVNHSKTLNIPVCIFHSKDDEVVLYNGGIFNQPIDNIVAEFTQKYGCTDLHFDDFPKIANDGITVKANRNVFECDPPKALKFYQITGAKHADFLRSDYETGPNDIDYLVEIWKFFEETKSSNIETVFATKNIAFFYPNPAQENISFSVSGNYELKEITGKAILKGNVSTGEAISIGNIPSGLYIVTLKSAEGNYVNKLIIK